jgi:hypothetical protein
MSHREPPEDRAPGVKWFCWVTGVCLALYGMWWLLWEMVT